MNPHYRHFFPIHGAAAPSHQHQSFPSRHSKTPTPTSNSPYGSRFRHLDTSEQHRSLTPPACLPSHYVGAVARTSSAALTSPAFSLFKSEIGVGPRHLWKDAPAPTIAQIPLSIDCNEYRMEAERESKLDFSAEIDRFFKNTTIVETAKESVRKAKASEDSLDLDLSTD